MTLSSFQPARSSIPASANVAKCRDPFGPVASRAVPLRQPPPQQRLQSWLRRWLAGSLCRIPIVTDLAQFAS